ncbi:Homeobox protein prophet of Pit-1 [Balamuthia mandrillaris]
MKISCWLPSASKDTDTEETLGAVNSSSTALATPAAPSTTTTSPILLVPPSSSSSSTDNPKNPTAATSVDQLSAAFSSSLITQTTPHAPPTEDTTTTKQGIQPTTTTFLTENEVADNDHRNGLLPMLSMAATSLELERSSSAAASFVYLAKNVAAAGENRGGIQPQRSFADLLVAPLPLQQQQQQQPHRRRRGSTSSQQPHHRRRGSPVGTPASTKNEKTDPGHHEDNSEVEKPVASASSPGAPQRRNHSRPRSTAVPFVNNFAASDASSLWQLPSLATTTTIATRARSTSQPQPLQKTLAEDSCFSFSSLQDGCTASSPSSSPPRSPSSSSLLGTVADDDKDSAILRCRPRSSSSPSSFASSSSSSSSAFIPFQRWQKMEEEEKEEGETERIRLPPLSSSMPNIPCTSSFQLPPLQIEFQPHHLAPKMNSASSFPAQQHQLADGRGRKRSQEEMMMKRMMMMNSSQNNHETTSYQRVIQHPVEAAQLLVAASKRARVQMLSGECPPLQPHHRFVPVDRKSNDMDQERATTTRPESTMPDWQINRRSSSPSSDEGVASCERAIHQWRLSHSPPQSPFTSLYRGSFSAASASGAVAHEPTDEIQLLCEKQKQIQLRLRQQLLLLENQQQSSSSNNRRSSAPACGRTDQKRHSYPGPASASSTVSGGIRPNVTLDIYKLGSCDGIDGVQQPAASFLSSSFSSPVGRTNSIQSCLAPRVPSYPVVVPATNQPQQHFVSSSNIPTLAQVKLEQSLGEESPTNVTHPTLEEDSKKKRATKMKSNNRKQKRDPTETSTSTSPPPSASTDSPPSTSSSNKNKRQRLKRICPNARQLFVLEEAFRMNPLPTRQTKEVISQQIGLSQERVQIWFQNRRARERKNNGASSSN